ncbi:hypothetical protein GCM10010978_01590 [Compostibacillus humi]|uniref:Post-transcriptional regulator n=1 Tax=Compostibacillus humi TaxID=1245525 RepID=A0A8J3EIZ6_9BACI|nr:post-transcriptional regulator [Compostibacillus humi]GGH68540.1 hypothetical protein GCM10010978_01590 [Compostibacillus humi]
MKIYQTVEAWKQTVQPAIESKVNELHTLGYNEASYEDVWNCLMEKVWKGNPEKRLYKVVQDILQLNTSTYLSYITVQSYQEDDLLASITAVTSNDDSNT